MRSRKSPVRVVCISDTHGRQRDPRIRPIPEGDILLHAGDLIHDHNRPQEYYDINRFLQEQKSFKHQFFVAGNHDWPFQLSKQATIDMFHGPIYLQDQFVEVMGFKIYGTPWQPEFCNWAFNLPRMGTKLQAAWEMIPEDTDILITHCPPFGIQDQIDPNSEFMDEHLGCPLLRERVEKVKPMLHVFGHIHGGYGAQEMTWDDGTKTIFVNAAICTERYEPLNNAVVVDLFPKKKS